MTTFESGPKTVFLAVGLCFKRHFDAHVSDLPFAS